MAGVVDAKHVEGFAFRPIGAAEQRVEAGDGEVTGAGQKHLEAHFLGLHGGGQVLGGRGLVGQGRQFHQVIEAHQLATGALVVAPLALQVVEA